MRALAIVVLSIGMAAPSCSAWAQGVVAPAPGLTASPPPDSTPAPSAAPNSTLTPPPPPTPAPVPPAAPTPPPVAAAPPANTAPKTAPTGPVLYSYKVDAWDAAAFANPGTSTLAYCAAAASYKNGITLAFALDSKFEW